MSWLVAAVVLGVSFMAAPVAVPMAVSAIGFESGGIAAGSWAASLMAGSGGVVAKGSTCAVLQSIGATGAIAGGTTIASLGGAIMAAGLSTLAVAKKRASSSVLCTVAAASLTVLSAIGAAFDFLYQ